jgi:hypothetical protein
LGIFCNLNSIEYEKIGYSNEILLELYQEAHIFIGWKAGKDNGKVCYRGIWDGDGFAGADCVEIRDVMRL